MDVRDIVFESIAEEEMTAAIRTDREGIISGIEEAVKEAVNLGMEVIAQVSEGERVKKDQAVLILRGTPKQMALAEDLVIGLMTKPSGIATAAAAFAAAAEGKCRVVCGSWKKLHPSVKEPYRKAVQTGGCGIRMLSVPMIYLDKNYIVMLGGIRDTLEALKDSRELEGKARVVQVKHSDDVARDCWEASEYGADVIFLDSGYVEDLEKLQDAMEYMTRKPLIAFAGDVVLADMEILKSFPVDIVGVGKGILDAPMLDMRMDVIPPKRKHSCCH